MKRDLLGVFGVGEQQMSIIIDIPYATGDPSLLLDVPEVKMVAHCHLTDLPLRLPLL